MPKGTVSQSLTSNLATTNALDTIASEHFRFSLKKN